VISTTSGAFLSRILGLHPLLWLDLHFTFFLHLHSPYQGPLSTTTVPLSLTPLLLARLQLALLCFHSAADLPQPCTRRSFPDLDSVFYFSATHSDLSTNISIPSRSRRDNCPLQGRLSQTRSFARIRTSWTSDPSLFSIIYWGIVACTALLSWYLVNSTRLAIHRSSKASIQLLGSARLSAQPVYTACPLTPLLRAFRQARSIFQNGCTFAHRAGLSRPPSSPQHAGPP
jgi:hypothetical protein